MTINLVNVKPVQGNGAGIYFVKNPDIPADNGIYVINATNQEPVKMANAVNMNNYLTVAAAIATYAIKTNPSGGQNNYAPIYNPVFTGTPLSTTPNSNSSGKQIITADWLKRNNNIVLRLEDNNALTNALYNVLIGRNVGDSINDADVNIIIGNNSGNSITNGNYNSIIGSEILQALILGNYNIGIGYSPLKSIITGDDNIGIGTKAGAKTGINDGGVLVTDLNKSIFIGKYSAAENNVGDTNEIAIGYNAQGKGSNTVVLGNDDITDTYIKGNVNLNGNFKYKNEYILNPSTDFTNILDITNISFSNNDLDDSLSLTLTNGQSKNHLLSVGDSFIADFYIDGISQSTIFEIATIIDSSLLIVNNPYFLSGNHSSTINMIVTNYSYINRKTIISLNDLTQKVCVDIKPEYTNIFSLGAANNAWKDIYAQDTSINLSDARKKTEVVGFTQDELNASKQLSKEIGTYKWLSAIQEKGENARKHIGMTVQRAIEVMEANNLNPFDYGFIGYDEWQDEFETIPAIEAKEAWVEEVKGTRYEIKTIPATEDEPERQEVIEVEKVIGTIEHPAIEAKEAYRIQTKVAGSIYSFRYTELLSFIARGFEERLTALENK